MASILDVAKYILHKLGRTTTMKLEKLCYYCQAWSLAWDDVPLFNEDFEAWANGPVCPALYKLHENVFAVDEGLFKDRPDFQFNSSEKESMDLVLKEYGDKEPHWLSELTHQEAPWRLARYGVPVGEECSNIITKKSMQAYYGGLL